MGTIYLIIFTITSNMKDSSILQSRSVFTLVVQSSSIPFVTSVVSFYVSKSCSGEQVLPTKLRSYVRQKQCLLEKIYGY